MTGRIEKSIFISYRRTNAPWALAVYQNLTSNGYDVFFDFNSISSGDFEQVILENIKARAHLIVILTPSALERCEEPGDWLRREIETGIEYKRNIVPLMMDGFDYNNPSIKKYLTGKLASLKNYNALRVPVEYFDEAMVRLRERFLNIPLDAVLHPVSKTVKDAVQVQQVAANSASKVDEKDLQAQRWFEWGNSACRTKHYVDAIEFYSETINIKPDFAEAYNNRATVYQIMGKLEEALDDCVKALGIKPNMTIARMSLFGILKNLGRVEEAKKQEQIIREEMGKELEYDQAWFEAICGNTEKALELLKIGLEKNQSTKEWARQDPDFETISNDPRFKELVEE